MERKLLILDLDETLIYGTERPLARAADARVGPFHIYKRPHVDGFVSAVSKWFDLAVWTSAGSSYAAGVVSLLVPDLGVLKFVWSCDRCTRRLDPETQEHYWLKNLRKVKERGYALERVLVVDDTAQKLERHYGNHIRVRPFLGDEADSELSALLPFLEWISAVANVRVVEKRDWRNLGRGDR